MNCEEINKEALCYLSEQNWEKAQYLFYTNAKKNPSHNSFNNLGYYLITEGLLCKSGAYRNANKLGLEYLFKAAKLKESQINSFAIATAYDDQTRTADSAKRNNLYELISEYLRKALKAGYSDEIEYNLLRTESLLNPNRIRLVEEARTLVNRYISEESVRLYFELLRLNGLKEEAIECITRYREYLEDLDVLMFYSRYEMYEEGFLLCEDVLKNYSIDEFAASAIIECCVNTLRFSEAKGYAIKIQEAKDEAKYLVKDNWQKEVLIYLNTSSAYRRTKISEYKSIPPFVINICCYFGCETHSTSW